MGFGVQDLKEFGLLVEVVKLHAVSGGLVWQMLANAVKVFPHSLALRQQ